MTIKNQTIKSHIPIMAKPKGQKNTKNKAKHTKLLDKKINKQKAEIALRKERLKAIIKKAKE